MTEMTIMKEIDRTVTFNRMACGDLDVQRAAYTAGTFTAFCRVLEMMGHDVKSGTYNDEGCSRIAYLDINGEELMKNNEFTKAYYDLMAE